MNRPLMQRGLLMLVLLTITALATANPAPPAWVTEGPKLAEAPAAFELPAEILATKWFVEVELGGKPRRFVFDTGSPSMIDRSIVEELGLEVVATNQGRDGQGVIIETQIVQADMRIGGVTIIKVPMMAADFSASLPTRMFVGDGVLGSDLLPLGAWQLDLEQAMLRFNTERDALPHLENAEQLTLHQFGYPFMPLFDVHFSKDARSMAMFDTGSSALFSISPQDYGGVRQASGIGKTVSGFGSPGGSLGGQAPETELLRMALDSLSIDELVLGQVVTTRRALAPSLIGASLLEHYVVTLDAPSGRAFFTAAADKPLTTPSFGFSLALDGALSIGAVWEGSPAAAAGLDAGTVLTAINGTEAAFTEDGVRHALAAMEGETIALTWDGGAAELTREAWFP
ncbi:MAG: aspartyl protease family protein [Pseudomonadota bacterium]